MSFPFNFYDFVVIFAPGTLLLVALTPVVGIVSSPKNGILETAVLVAIAFVLGHFNQWVAKSLQTSVGQFIPFFKNTGAYLLDHPFSAARRGKKTFWKRLAVMLKTFFPLYFSMQQLDQAEIDRIHSAFKRSKYGAVRSEVALEVALTALRSGGKADVLAKREQFLVLADCMRSMATCLVLVGSILLIWGPPQFLVPAKFSLTQNLYGACALWFMAGAFVKRSLQFEFSGASLIFHSFEDLKEASGLSKSAR